MPSAPDARQVIRYYGPWRGLNEWPGSCADAECEDAWNVEFRGDLIFSRGGRSRLYALDLVYPVTAWFFTGDTGVPTDGSVQLTDGDSTTVFAMALQTTDAFYLGFPFPVYGVKLTAGTANANASVLSVKYQSQAAVLTTVPSMVDGTAAAGKTLAQTGTVSWGAITDWRYTAPPNGAAGPAAYWLRFSVSANLSGGTTISAAAASLASAGVVANGVFHWKRSTGERLLVLGLDDKTGGFARLASLDRYTGILRPFAIPGDLAKSGPDAFWSCVAVNDCLIAGNGYSFVRTVQPTHPHVLSGWTPATLKSSAARQVTAPTQVSALALYQSQLAVVERGSQIVQLSDPIGATYDLDGTSSDPLGGLTIWDVRSNFNCVDSRGGNPNGFASQGSRLLVFTPGSTQAWDGFSHQILDPDIGCVAPRTIRSADGKVFFLGPGRVYRNEGGRNAPISMRVDPTLRKMDWLGAPYCVAEVYHRSKQYRLHIPLGTAGKNTHAVVYNYELDHWEGKFGTPTYRYNFESNGANGRAYEVAATGAARDDEWWEELLTFDYSGNVILEDTGLADVLSASGVIPWALKFARGKWNDQGVVVPRYVRAELSSFINGVCGVAVASDGRNPLDPDPADSTNGFVEVGTMTLLDQSKVVSDSGGAPQASKQCMANATSGAGVRLNVDSWRPRRFQSARASFGVTGRAIQVGMYGEANLIDPLILRGIEIDVIPGGRR